jgi:predicted XRE-type DNA-binding protein
MKEAMKKVTAYEEEEIEVIEGSGNIFADLGLPDPEEWLVKAQLALQIKRIVEAKGWNQKQAAAHAGLDQAKISALMRGKLKGFSTDRLLRVLNSLGRRVEVRISAREYAPGQARTSVAVAR